MRCTPVLIAISAAVALTVTACSSSPPPQMTVNGTVEVAVTDYSEFQADYPQDMTYDTAQATVTNPSGTVIAVTTADNGNVAQGLSEPDDMTLTTGFTVQKVPEGLSFSTGSLPPG